MGTRGLFGFQVDGLVKVGYNQYDSYPDGRGLQVLDFVRRNTTDSVGPLIEKARRLKVVNDKINPTPADVVALQQYTNLEVSAQSTADWYCLTHHSHGDLQAILDCGYILDGADFAYDSLFCEWGYIVDLDNLCLDVYKGFNEAVPTEGIWAGDERHTRGYYAINRVASFPFTSLPEPGAFLDQLEPDEED
jgi:hypothetical protein